MSDYLTDMLELGGTRGAFPRAATIAAEAAITAGSGALFDAIIEAICRNNTYIKPELANEVVRELLGPMNLEDIFEHRTRIKSLPSAVKIDGEWVQILETDPLTVMLLATGLGALRAATYDAYGGLAGYQNIRAGLEAEGGDPTMADEKLLRDFNNQRRAVIEAARRGESLAPAPSPKQSSGCAPAAVFAIVLPPTLILVLLEWLHRA